MSNEELVQLIQQGTDPAENMGKLYQQNQGLIYSTIKVFRYACQADYNSTPIIEMDELMHEAYFGLVKAAESYDSGQGILFMSYATTCIRQAVKRFLDNCGRVVRVPVHTQEKIYRYNQVSAYYLQNFNRLPSIREYAAWLHISERGIEKLQRFMFQDKVKSLDVAFPGTENEDITVGDTLASDINIEYDVIEKVAQEQLKSELWDRVSQVLKHDKMVTVLRYRFIDRFSLDETGKRMGITRERVRQYEVLALRRLRCNSRTKRMFEDYLTA